MRTHTWVLLIAASALAGFRLGSCQAAERPRACVERRQASPATPSTRVGSKPAVRSRATSAPATSGSRP